MRARGTRDLRGREGEGGRELSRYFEGRGEGGEGGGGDGGIDPRIVASVCLSV